MVRRGIVILILVTAVCGGVISRVSAGGEDYAAVWMERGRKALQDKDRFAALRAFGEARRLEPGNGEAARAVADILLDLGAPYAAEDALGGKGDLGIRSRQAASVVRWGALVKPRDPVHRFDTTDKALRRIDALLKEARSAVSIDIGVVTRLVTDRIIALRDRERWADAVADTAALRAGTGSVPAYVRQAEADSLLALRYPRQARYAYQDAIDAYRLQYPSGLLPVGPGADPAYYLAREGLIYAEVEDEDFAAAFATVDALAAEEKSGIIFKGSAMPQPNSDWLGARILSALVRSYADMHAAAWEQLLPLAERAPAVSYLRAALAHVAAERGWDRRAEEEAEIAASLAPDDLGVRIQLADSDIRRRNWKRAEERIRALREVYPNDENVKRLTKDFNAYLAPEVIGEISGTKETGNAGLAPGNGYEMLAQIYSAPISERFRVLAATVRAWANLQEGPVARNRFGAGFDGRWPDVTLEAIFWANTGAVDRLGATVSGNWEINDNWTIFGDLQRYAPDTPLRAVFYGITADSAGGSVVYASNESLVASIDMHAYNFTDGNRRGQVSADVAVRVIDVPHFDLTLRPKFYASGNTSSDAPYFNPRNDIAGELAVEMDHIIWRSYDRKLSQRFVADCGGYWQRYYDTGVIGEVLYQQTYSVDPSTEFTFGVEGNRAIYDGQPEYAGTVFMRIRHKYL